MTRVHAMLNDLPDMACNFLSRILNLPVRFSQSSVPAVKCDDINSGVLNKLGIKWVLNHAPGFYLNSKQVKVLHTPQSFYESLLEHIQKSQQRIVLASLYLGTGELEKKIVFELEKKLKEISNLNVKILLDCSRGSRGEINSRKMLIPLLNNHFHSCKVNLYQTPFLPSLPFPFLPQKYKEISGLQHIKVYLFDNNLIITGANLSNDYFTNRQDRYILINNCKELCDFIEGLVDKVSEFSLRLNAENKLDTIESSHHNPLTADPKIFHFAASTSIKNYYESYIFNYKNEEKEKDTIIFPLIEMGPFDIHIDSKITNKILETCEHDTVVHLTTGYFNLTQSYIDTIINRSKARYKILMAHPTANGFYKAKGLAGGIPYAYTNIALKFLHEVRKNQELFRIKLFEYKRTGWTYHAKGLWLSSLKFQLPFLTMIGSPNFGERSLNHDLECQFLVATVDERLQSQLLYEREHLYGSCHPFTKAVGEDPGRRPPLWVKVMVWLFKTYF